MYYGPNKRSRRIVYELLASPKATKACIFIENSTFISAAFDYWSKDNNNHKKGLFSRTIPEGFNPAALALSEQLKRSLYSLPLGPTSNGLLGSKPMTKKIITLLFCGNNNRARGRETRPRTSFSYTPFCYWRGKLQRLEINGEALREKKGRKKREQHKLKWRIRSPKKSKNTISCQGFELSMRHIGKESAAFFWKHFRDCHLYRNTRVSANPDPRWTLYPHFPPLLTFKDNQKRRNQSSRGQRRRWASPININEKCWIRWRCVQYLHHARCCFFFRTPFSSPLNEHLPETKDELINYSSCRALVLLWKALTFELSRLNLYAFHCASHSALYQRLQKALSI